MIQTCENLSFVAKAFENELRVHSALDEFNGDGLLKFAVVARRQIHSAHSAAPDFLRDFKRAESCADQTVLFVEFFEKFSEFICIKAY